MMSQDPRKVVVVVVCLCAWFLCAWGGGQRTVCKDTSAFYRSVP